VESVGVSPISPPCLLVNGFGSAESFLRIMLRIPRQLASPVVYVLPQLSNVDVLPQPHRRVHPRRVSRRAGILRNTDRESRKLRPGPQQIDPVRVHVLT
jgi:hypothetical protein